MNNIYLIDEDYIKSRTPVYDNLDPKRLKSHILEAQDINLKYLLPKTLYKEIFTQLKAYQVYRNDGGTDPIEDKVDERILDLIDQIKPMLVYYTLYQGAYSLFSVITNEGINTQHSTDSKGVTEEFLYKQKNIWKSKGQSYGNILIEFIIENIDDYPEYSDNDTYDDTGKKFRNAIYLGPSI